jgi:hypothetical protein
MNTRSFANDFEHKGQDLHQTVATLRTLVDDLKVLYELVSPLIERLKAATSGNPSSRFEL